MSWPCPLLSLWRPSFTNRLRDVSLPSHLSIFLFSLALSLSFSFSRQSATKVLLTMWSFAVLHCVLRRLLIVGTLCLRILRLQLDGILYAGPRHFAIVGLLASRFCRVALLPVTGCFVVGLMLSIHCLRGRALRLFSFFLRDVLLEFPGPYCSLSTSAFLSSCVQRSARSPSSCNSVL